MEKIYQVPTELYYLNIEKLKERDLNILKNSIADSNFGTDYLKFSSFANISFDEADTKHKTAIITEYEIYNRLKVNCLIFDIVPNIFTDNIYNKLFVFMTTGEKGYFGYFMYNTETGKTIHKYLLDPLPDYLIQSLHRDFHVIYNYDMYDYYLHRSISPRKARLNNIASKDIFTDMSYKDMLKKYEDRIDKYYKTPNEDVA